MFREFAIDTLTANAVEKLRMFANDQPYYGCFSGGKDSVVIKRLVEMAGVDCEWHYHVTTIDPPELVRFIKAEHKDVIWDRPAVPFFIRAENRYGGTFPTRRVRWCCAEYKENNNAAIGQTMIMGIRAAESVRRAKRWREIQTDRRGNRIFAPILQWLDSDVWQFIRANDVPYCSLYDEGFERLGCVGCPMAGKAGRLRAFARWPRYEYLWRRLFDRIWAKRHNAKQRDGRDWFGDRYFDNANEMFEWWLSDESLPSKNGCGSFFDGIDLNSWPK